MDEVDEVSLIGVNEGFEILYELVFGLDLVEVVVNYVVVSMVEVVNLEVLFCVLIVGLIELGLGGLLLIIGVNN